MIGKWFLPLPFIFANKNYTLTFSHYEKQERIMLDNVWKPEPATTKYTNI